MTKRCHSSSRWWRRCKLGKTRFKRLWRNGQIPNFSNKLQGRQEIWFFSLQQNSHFTVKVKVQTTSSGVHVCQQLLSVSPSWCYLSKVSLVCQGPKSVVEKAQQVQQERQQSVLIRSTGKSFSIRVCVWLYSVTVIISCTYVCLPAVALGKRNRFLFPPLKRSA